MPARTPTPCRVRGCTALVSDRSGYCENHKSESWSRYRKQKISGKNPYGAKWRKLRDAAMCRDRGLCVLCLANGRAVPATDVAGSSLFVFGPEVKTIDFQILVNPDNADTRAAVKSEVKAWLKRDGQPEATLEMSRLDEAISAASGEYNHKRIFPDADIVLGDIELPVAGIFTWTQSS